LLQKNILSWPPSSNLTPASRSFAALSPISDSLRESVAVTMARGYAEQSCGDACPRHAYDQHALIFSSTGPACLPQFQSRQREQRKYQRAIQKRRSLSIHSTSSSSDGESAPCGRCACAQLERTTCKITDSASITKFRLQKRAESLA